MGFLTYNEMLDANQMEAERAMTETPKDNPSPVGIPFEYHYYAGQFAAELARARSKFGPMASAHEGYAVLLEEMDELKAIVWQKQSERDYDAMRKEIVCVGAMALAFLMEIVETENRR